MARRRTLSADLLSDPEWNALSDAAKTMFIRMLLVTDDCGVVPGDMYRLGSLTQLDDKTRAKLPALVKEIIERGMVHAIQHDGKPFLVFKPRTFEEYQSYFTRKRTRSEYLKVSAEEFETLSGNFPESPGTSGKFQAHKDIKIKDIKIKDKNREAETEKWFAEIWAGYPLKTGKVAALRHFRATVKTPEDFKKIQQALTNYRNSRRVRQGYIQNGSTWFNQWQDWIDLIERDPEEVKKEQEREEWIKRHSTTK